MAKRNTATRREGHPVSRKVPIVEYHDGGIYPREIVTGYEHLPALGDEHWMALVNGHLMAKPLLTQLSLAERRAAEIARQVVPPEALDRVLNPPPNQLVTAPRYVPDSDVPICNDGAEALDAANILNLVAKTRRLIAAALQKPDGYFPAHAMPEALNQAYLLGRLHERVLVRPHEPAARKGKAQAQRARTAGKTRQLLTGDQQRQAAEEIAALVTGAGMSPEAACKALVSKYGVGLSTLKRCRPTV